MTLDFHWALNFLFGIVLMGIGWFCREIWDAVQTLRDDLAALETQIGTDYVRYDRLQDLLKPLDKKLDQLADTIRRVLERP